MIPSRRSGAFSAWFAGHARGRIQRAFGRFFVRGLAPVRAIAAPSPLLLTPNPPSRLAPPPRRTKG